MLYAGAVDATPMTIGRREPERAGLQALALDRSARPGDVGGHAFPLRVAMRNGCVRTIAGQRDIGKYVSARHVVKFVAGRDLQRWSANARRWPIRLVRRGG